MRKLFYHTITLLTLFYILGCSSNENKSEIKNGKDSISAPYRHETPPFYGMKFFFPHDSFWTSVSLLINKNNYVVMRGYFCQYGIDTVIYKGPYKSLITFKDKTDTLYILKITGDSVSRLKGNNNTDTKQWNKQWTSALFNLTDAKSMAQNSPNPPFYGIKYFNIMGGNATEQSLTITKHEIATIRFYGMFGTERVHLGHYKNPLKFKDGDDTTAYEIIGNTIGQLDKNGNFDTTQGDGIFSTQFEDEN